MYDGLCTVPLLLSRMPGVIHSRYLSSFCMYGLCTVPLLLSQMPGWKFSVSVPILYVWRLFCTVPLRLSRMPGVLLPFSVSVPISVCMGLCTVPHFSV
ncbi:unnamed protein product, partial [Staurois parvus]